MQEKLTRKINHRITVIKPDGIKQRNATIKYSIDKEIFIKECEELKCASIK